MSRGRDVKVWRYEIIGGEGRLLNAMQIAQATDATDRTLIQMIHEARAHEHLRIGGEYAELTLKVARVCWSI